MENGDFLIQYIKKNGGKIFYIPKDNKKYLKHLKRILLKNRDVYVVGISKKKLLHRMTVYEELFDLLKNEQKVIEYVEKRKLSSSRLDRPLSSLSSEKWRASIAIGIASGKKIFFIPDLSDNVLIEYWSLWMESLFYECCKSGITLVIITDCKNASKYGFDVLSI